MKNLYDIAESILDDADILMSNAHSAAELTAAVEWLKKHGVDYDFRRIIKSPDDYPNLYDQETGTWHLIFYDIRIVIDKKDKNIPDYIHIDKVTSVVIQDYKGETIPECFVPGFQATNVIIRNCPNLKSLEGCPQQLSTFSISNCPKITSLNGCPQEVNKLFKVLNCGKPFTDKDIRRACKVDKKNIICSFDEDVKEGLCDVDIYESEDVLCEAFKDPRLYQIWRSLKQRNSVKFKDLVKRGYDVAWDRFDGNDIQEISLSDVETIFTDIRKHKRSYGTDKERPFVVFGLLNEDIYCMYDTYSHMTATFGRNGYVEWHDSDENNSRLYMPQRDQFNYFRKCDYLLKVYVDEKNVRDLQIRRQSSQSGSLPTLDKDDKKTVHNLKGELGVSAGGMDTSYWAKHRPGQYYSYCQTLVEKAVKKWKEIVAENKFKKIEDDDTVDKAVGGIMSRITKATINAQKDPQKYSRSNTGISVDGLLKLVYDKYSSSTYRNQYHTTGNDELLALYAKYCETNISLKQSSAYNKNDAMKSRENFKKTILSKVLRLDEILKKFDA